MSESKFDYSGLKRVVKIGMSYRGLFTAVVIVAILSAIVSTYRPYLMKDAIDQYILLKDLPGLFQFIFIIVAVLIFEVILQFFVIFLANKIAQRVIKYLRVRLFNHIIRFKLGYFDRTPNGVLVTRSVSDIETIAEIFNNGILTLMVDALRIIFMISIMYYMNWSLATIVILILPLMVVITNLFQKALKKVYQAERTLTAKLNTFVQERLTGINIVQLFNRQAAEFENFKVINKELRTAFLKTNVYFALLFPVVDVVSAVAIGLLLWFGGLRTALEGDVSVGEMIAFISYIGMLTQPMRQIADRFNAIQRGLIGADRVFKILDDDQTLPNKGNEFLNEVKGEIDFKDVQFSYIPDSPVLKGISFHSEPGQKIAIVGATGAGKSTIINLLSRFYDIDSGDILIDGKSIYSMELKNLRSHIAVVLQDVFLFNSTIYENIILGKTNISLEEVQKAAKDIGIHEFIMSLPKGYHSEVSERGGTLSVGQRQLISFLRAYVYNPQILVLDEATSSIDTESESLIQNATEKLTEGRTSIIIAHRLATIQNADQILVMDDGKIVERGTHSELLKQEGYYNNLYEVQFQTNE
ncbi:ABC transporter ATP-binding protein [Moheibacter sediminis]|uniref:ABC-type multidrug transport system, ATPase and permease component n=1 Tax=Moheibacter sediminis TaxID=1434700 RepID=A0A1W2BVG0_9FLAO|nr:ABC transporter ATP-binding protein [Moheibacter sediminis]SMC76927.1 ABC-type multidrug transport system, ATPase and permease component [Moheibacter sediminis]